MSSEGKRTEEDAKEGTENCFIMAGQGSYYLLMIATSSCSTAHLPCGEPTPRYSEKWRVEEGGKDGFGNRYTVTLVLAKLFSHADQLWFIAARKLPSSKVVSSRQMQPASHSSCSIQ